MKKVADWIREWSPDWTDEERYKVIRLFHLWELPLSPILFVFFDNMILRFVLLMIGGISVITNVFLRDCYMTMLEREFSQSSWDDAVDIMFRNAGWELNRSEKIALVIGTISGMFIMSLLILLRQSILWIVGFTGIAVTVLPTLAWFSKVPHLPEIVVLPSS